ncbi:MAG: hypothetical protein ACRDPB_05210 [Nocardioidaceae bacterium]
MFGAGENEGQPQTAAQAVAASESGSSFQTLEDAMAGKGAADLERALEQATPGAREQFEPPASCT